MEIQMTDANPQFDERTAPPELPRDDVPFNPAHAACDGVDEPDTDVELADDGGPCEGTQFSNDD